MAPHPETGPLSRKVLELTRHQHGVISRRQLVDHGVSLGAVAGRRRAKWLLPAGPGVYALGRPVTSSEGIWWAALLAAGQDACLARLSAALLWGLLKVREPAVEIVRPESRKPQRFRMSPPGLVRDVRVRVTRSERLGTAETTMRFGLPVTTVCRTLIDLGISQGESRQRSAFHEADRLGLLETKSLMEYAARSVGLPGGSHFRRLVEARHPETAVTRSELEVMFLDVCRGAGIESPQVNQVVEGFEVDCLWAGQRLIIELDGFKFHRGRMAFDKDADRDFLLKRAGYRVTRITYPMVKHRPAEVATLLRAELGP